MAHVHDVDQDQTFDGSLPMVGDVLDTEPYRSQFLRELPAVRATLKIVDLTGLPLASLKEQVASLPERSAIAYTGINIDGNMDLYTPREALRLLAAVANRPIVVDVETYLDSGATGGFVLRPGIVGKETAELVLQMLRGDPTSQLPTTASDAIQPVFDWRQLQRWKVSESQLPAGSDILHREKTFFEEYYWHIVGFWAAATLLIALFIALLLEDRNRRKAQHAAVELRTRLAHIDRAAVAGELSATIAHEVRQPLTSILGHGAACIHWLEGKKPNIEEARTALKKLINEGHRASQILEATRALFKSDRKEMRGVNVNTLIRNVLSLLASELNSSGIQLKLDLRRTPAPRVDAVEVQLQQVILNLIMNAIDAMKQVPVPERQMIISALVSKNNVFITVTDSGPGIEPKNRELIFQPFFTTKKQGMGMGLSVCRSIIQAHRGQLNTVEGQQRGASLQIVLPYSGIQGHDRKSA